MSLEPIRDRHVAANRHEPTDQQDPTRPETGSVWWAELALGTLSCLAAVVVILASSSIGPLSSLTVTLGTIPMAVYLLAASTIGLILLTSGLERSPYRDRLD